MAKYYINTEQEVNALVELKNGDIIVHKPFLFPEIQGYFYRYHNGTELMPVSPGTICYTINGVNCSVVQEYKPKIIDILWGYSSQNLFKDTATAPIIQNPQIFKIITRFPISFKLPASAQGKHIIWSEPVKEYEKKVVENLPFNISYIPDEIIRAPFVVDGIRYYMTADPAGYVFNPQTDVTLR